MSEYLEHESARLADNCLRAITSAARVHPDCWARLFNEQIKKALSDAEARGLQRAIDLLRSDNAIGARWAENMKTLLSSTMPLNSAMFYADWLEKQK